MPLMRVFHFRYAVPTRSSIVLTSNVGNSSMQIVGSNITLICTVELNSAFADSEIFLLMVDVELSRDGTPLGLALRGPTASGKTLTYTTQLNLLEKNDSGNYVCTAGIRPLPTLTYLTGNETLMSDFITIKAGKRGYWLDLPHQMLHF